MNELMKTIPVHLPESLDLDESRLNEYLAVKLYADGKLSLAKAAEMVQVAKWDFPKVLTRYGVPYFNYSAEEFARDVRSA